VSRGVILACLAICSNTSAQTSQSSATRPAATRPAGDFKLRGRIVDDAGTPVEGAEVRNWQDNGQTETDAQGRFVFDDLPVVKSSLWVNHEGFVSESREYVMPPDGRVPELVIKLRRLGGISGIVVGPDEVPDARSTSFSVEEDGSFQMPGLLPGKYDINISVQGPYESVNKRAQLIKTGETLKLDLKLKPRQK
jgi:hypothetical protein